MTKVAILPVPTESGAISYSAVAGDKQTKGKTAGEALDALTAQLTEDEGFTETFTLSRVRSSQSFINTSCNTSYDVAVSCVMRCT